jgi:RNA-directed DNA polymerase
LLEQFSFDNLYTSYLNCRRGKRHTTTAIKYEIDALEETYDLAVSVQNRKYKPSSYHTFSVYEPKEREIMALPFRDRVVQHCLCKNVLEPAIEPMLIYDTYACRKNKGTHAGLYRLEEFLRKHYRKHGTVGWILKGDISKYFNSIDHDILKAKLYPKLDDDIIWLLDEIIDSTENPGLPLGNQSSQWFANFYLSSFDHFIKEKLRIKYYIRYMDDFCLIHPSKDYLRYCLKEIKNYLNENLKLQTNNKTQLFPIKNGVDFLGFHTYITDTGKVIRKIRRKSKQNMKRKLKKYKKLYVADKITKERINLSYQSWLGHASHGNCYHLIQNMNEKYKEIFEGDG